MALPAASYLVCASQRSGTTMLCRALADTGIAGRPEEYFLAVDDVAQPGWRCWEHGPYGVANNARSREEYLGIVYRLGSTPNGVFGAKLMWNNLRWAEAKFEEIPRFSGLDRAGIFHAAFPGLRIVNVTRRDRVRQAVSWARMAQDGVWVMSDQEPARPTGHAENDADRIGAFEALIIEGERGWLALYGELGLTPYEDLVSDEGYEQTVRGVLAHVGLPSAGMDVPRIPYESAIGPPQRGVGGSLQRRACHPQARVKAPMGRRVPRKGNRYFRPVRRATIPVRDGRGSTPARQAGDRG